MWALNEWTNMTTAISPAISIIVPFFNAGRYLLATLQAVLAQSFEDWELLLVDDGSHDPSTLIALDFSRSDSQRIRYLEHADHRNLGQFASRVFAAEHARSEVVALLDADDLWMPEYLTEHLAFWRHSQERDVALSYGPALFWYDDDRGGSQDYVQAMPLGTPKIYVPGELLEEFCSGNYAVTPCPSAAFMRRTIFSEVGCWSQIAKDSLAYEDQILWWYIAARYSVSTHSSILVHYRQHAQSSVNYTQADRSRAYRAELSFLQLAHEYLSVLVPRHSLLRTKTLKQMIVRREKALGRIMSQSIVNENRAIV